MNRVSRLPRLIIGIAGLAAATWFTIDSFNPQHYFRYAHQVAQQPWTHPTVAVVFVAISTLLEAWLLYTVVDERSSSPMWTRALMGLCVLGPWGYLSTMVVMHAPGFIRLHALWVWSLLFVLLGVLVISGAGTLMHARHERIRESGRQAG